MQYYHENILGYKSKIGFSFSIIILVLFGIFIVAGKNIEKFSFSLFLLFFGVLLLFGGFQKLKLKRLIENLPTSKIRSIAIGLVEIYGEVVPGKIMIKAPMSNKDCVYYKYTIEEYTGGKNKRWVKVKVGEGKTNFYLKDETGKVLVDPNNFELDIIPSFEVNSGLGRDPSEDIKKFIKSVDINFEGIFGINKKMRYRVYSIHPKDKLYILGTATENSSVINPVEGVDNIIINKEKKNPYYISNKSEKEILGKFKFLPIGFLTFGAILVIMAMILAGAKL